MSSSDRPSSKRARVDEEDDDSEATSTGTSPVQKDEEVWLSDGNVVVVAAKKVAFRVHKSILSLRSEIFADLFSLPDGDVATEETMDGCPVVHVSDAPDDIRRLFLVLCCGKNYYYNEDVLVPVPFAVLASLVRMAHKYAISDVLADALSRLKKYYTHNLLAWQDPPSRARYVTAADDDAPAAVALARLTNTPLLLPAALLVCVGLASRVPPPWAADTDDSDTPSADAALSALSAHDRARLMHAKGLLTQACATRALHLLAAVPCASCTSRRACSAASEVPLDACRDYRSTRYFVWVPYVSDELAFKPIAPELWRKDDALLRFCGNCRDALAKMDEKGMKVLWYSLPEMFEVDVDPHVWRSGTSSAGANRNE